MVNATIGSCCGNQAIFPRMLVLEILFWSENKPVGKHFSDVVEIPGFLCCVKMISSHVKLLIASVPTEKAEKALYFIDNNQGCR